MAVMAQRKKTSEERPTPRKPVQIPVAWYELARRIAAHRKQPTAWLILTLLAEEAERVGFDRPPLPWEDADG